MQLFDIRFVLQPVSDHTFKMREEVFIIRRELQTYKQDN